MNKREISKLRNKITENMVYIAEDLARIEHRLRFQGNLLIKDCDELEYSLLSLLDYAYELNALEGGKKSGK